MDRDNLKLFISLANFVLNQATLQTGLTKMVLLFQDNMTSVAELRDRMSRLPVEDVERLRDEFDVTLQNWKITNDQLKRQLLDALAGQESNHEKMEAVIAQLKKSFGEPSGPDAL